MVFEDFVWLWGSSDRQGASSVVLPSSSSSGRMWSSWPIRRLPVRNQQHQADSGRSNSGGAPSTRSRGWRWRASQKSRCNFHFSWDALYCSLFLLMLESYSQKKTVKLCKLWLSVYEKYKYLQCKMDIVRIILKNTFILYIFVNFYIF
jgi:hypothetical protein